MTAAEYFTQMYAGSSDPWHLAERPYEQRKYTLTAASLPRHRYRRGFEPGCSIGLLTTLLAPRCDELIATDTVAAPLQRARQAVPSSHVRFETATIPDTWPPGELDLVVLSEILYFLSADQRGRVLDHVVRSLGDDGHLVLVHWRHPFAEAACTGDQAHDEVRAAPGLTPLVQHVERDFRLEVLGRA